MLRSDLCDYFDVYIVVKGNTTVTKKTFTANDFEAPTNTAANAAVFMLHLIIAFRKLTA